MNTKQVNTEFWKLIEHRNELIVRLGDAKDASIYAPTSRERQIASADIEVLSRDLFHANAEVKQMLDKYKNSHLPWYKRIFKK